MNSYQKRTLQAFRRSQGWLASHPELGVAAARHVATLDQIVAQLSANGADQEMQDRAARDAVADTARLRKELVTQQMRHVAIMAETAIPDVTVMTVALRRPTQADAEGILAAAAAMAKAAVQYQQVLVERGMPADFVEQLQHARTAFKRSIDARGAALGQRHYAVEATRDFVQQGHRVIETLSVLIELRYRDDRSTLAEWRQVKRVVVVGVRAPADAPVVPPAPMAIQPATTVVQATTTPIQPAGVMVQTAAA